MHNREVVTNYLVNHKDKFVTKYKRFLQQQDEMMKNEKDNIKTQIAKQFRDVFNWTVAKEISSNTSVNIEEALIVVENVNFDEVLNASGL